MMHFRPHHLTAGRVERDLIFSQLVVYKRGGGGGDGIKPREEKAENILGDENALTMRYSVEESLHVQWGKPCQ